MSVCIREPLTADRTYYVRTDGNDNNNGLTNNAAGAFLTIQKAVDTVADQIDIRGVDVTIQVANGAYNAPVSLRPYVGRTINPYGPTLRGDPSTPSNVTIDLSTGACISGYSTPVWMIDGFSLSTTGTGTYCVSVNNAQIVLRSMEYRASVIAHVRAIAQGTITLQSSYAVKGSAQSHLLADLAGIITITSGVTGTVTGTPTFSTAFAFASATSVINTGAVTFTGSATGTRYLVYYNAVIGTNAGGPNLFPGSIAGNTDKGGQYAG